MPCGLAARDLGVVGQELELAVELAGLLERLHEPPVHADQRRAELARHAEQHVLLVVVAQHVRGDVVGDVGEQPVALVAVDRARGDGPVEQDLEVDLVVGGVDAGGVVDGVGVDAAAGQRELDAGALGEAEVAALADDPAAQLVGVDAQRRRWPCRRRRALRLGRGLDVGADAAVPEQVDRRVQDRVDQLGRASSRTCPTGSPSAAATCGLDRDRSSAVRGYTPPPAEMSSAS